MPFAPLRAAGFGIVSLEMCRLRNDDRSLYWTDGYAGTVKKVMLAGGTPVCLVSGLAHPLGIAVDASRVYWTNYLNGTVTKVTPK
jgi:hypothetical protein